MSKHTLWKTLSCDLTQDEVAMYSNSLAISTTEQAEIEAEKKEVMSTFQARLNKCIADQRLLARKITTRKEDRQVECDLEFDYARGMVYTVRMDTGVTIDQRKLTDDERQERLDFEGEQDAVDEAADQVTEPITEQGPESPIDPPDLDNGFTICGNKECEHYDRQEANHCGLIEHVFECDKATADELCQRCHGARPDCPDENGKCCETCGDPCNMQQVCLVKEGELEAQQTEAAEAERRDSICKEWRDCEHKDICFTEQNEEDGICFISEPDKLPAKSDFSRDELKVIEHFPLVRYNREAKIVEVSDCDQDKNFWRTLPIFTTYAAAERSLASYKEQGYIETGLDGKIIMTGWNRPGKLMEAGFEFYRAYGFKPYDDTCCIKVGSKNWANLAKYPNRDELQAAWDSLMNDPKALEG